MTKLESITKMYAKMIDEVVMNFDISTEERLQIVEHIEKLRDSQIAEIKEASKDKITRRTSNYGFEEVEVVTADGGRIKITDFTSNGDTVDIGNVHCVNGHGLGFGEYIRNWQDVTKKQNGILRTTWISNEAKKVLIDFLEEIEFRGQVNERKKSTL